MKAVYKYPITAEPTQKVTLPAGARILTVGVQGDDAYLWALVDTNGAPTDRVVVVVGTGHDASGSSAKFRPSTTGMSRDLMWRRSSK